MKPSGMVEEFVKTVCGVVPHPIVERNGEGTLEAVEFQLRFRFQNGISRIGDERMKDAFAVGSGNKPVIHEKLSSRTQSQRFGNVFQIGNGKDVPAFRRKILMKIRFHVNLSLQITVKYLYYNRKYRKWNIGKRN